MTGGSIGRAVVRIGRIAQQEALKVRQRFEQSAFFVPTSVNALSEVNILQHRSQRLAKLQKLATHNFQKETAAAGHPLKQKKKEKQQVQRDIRRELDEADLAMF
eukprot:jgi/Mesen1/4570/ME000232S03825